MDARKLFKRDTKKKTQTCLISKKKTLWKPLIANVLKWNDKEKNKNNLKWRDIF